ncbi:hypothetical protein ABK040_016066 [Willaertia magna]
MTITFFRKSHLLLGIIVVILMMLGILFSSSFVKAEGIKTPDDPIRKAILRSGVIGNPLKGAGANIDRGVVRVLGRTPRTALYDYGTSTFGIHNVPPRIEDFNFGSNTSIDGAIDYSQGVAAFASFGLSLFVFIILFLVIPLIVLTCYACCSKCCDRCNPEVKDNIFRDQDPEGWVVSHKRRRKIQNICKIIFIAITILNLCLMIVWLVFSYQANIDFSKAIDQAVAVYNDIDKLVDEAISLTSDAFGIVGLIEKEFSYINKTVLSQLPNNDKITSWTNCVQSLIDAAPRLTLMKNSFDDVRKYINFSIVPKISTTQNLLSGVQNILSQTSQQGVSNVKLAFNNLKGSIGTISTPLNQLVQDLTSMSTSLQSMTDLSKITTTLTKVDDLVTNTLTSTFMSSFVSDLQNFGADDSISNALLKQELETLKDAVQQIQSFNLNSAVTALQSLQSKLDSMPSATTIQTEIDNLKTAINQVDMDTSINAINSFNYSLNQVESNYTYTRTAVLDIKNILINFPSLSVIYSEIDKIKLYIDALATKTCIDDIIDSIKVINETIIELPDTTVFDIYYQLQRDLKANNTDTISNYLQTVNDTKSNVIPDAKAKLDDFLNKPLNLSSLNFGTITILVPSPQFNDTKNRISYTAIMSAVQYYHTQRSGVPNLGDYATKVQDLNTATNDVSITNIDYSINKLSTAPSTCGPSRASDTTCQSLYPYISGISTKFNAFRTALNNRPATTTVSNSLSLVASLRDSTLGKLTTDLNLLTQLKIIYSSFSIDKALTVMDNIKTGLQNYLKDIPFSTVSDKLSSLKSNVDGLPFNSINNQISNIEDSFKDINDIKVSGLFDKIDTNLISSSLNIDSILGRFNSITKSVNGTLKEIIWYKDDITYQLTHIYVNDIYKYDGIRLLVILIFLFVILPIPLFTISPALCPRWPVFLLLGSLLMITISILGSIIIFFILPVNIALVDTCDNAEVYINKAIAANGASVINTTYTFDEKVLGTNISLSIKPLNIIENMITICPTNDPILNTINSTTKVVRQLDTEILKVITSATDGKTKLRPAFTNSVTNTVSGVTTKVLVLIDRFANISSCNSLSNVYGDLKEAICVTATNFIACFWFIYLLLIILFVINSFISFIGYCCLKKNWNNPRVKERKKKKTTQYEGITTPRKRGNTIDNPNALPHTVEREIDIVQNVQMKNMKRHMNLNDSVRSNVI